MLLDELENAEKREIQLPENSDCVWRESYHFHPGRESKGITSREVCVEWLSMRRTADSFTNPFVSQSSWIFGIMTSRRKP
jgi:hypothetical protein